MVLKDKTTARQHSYFLNPTEETFYFYDVKAPANKRLSYLPCVDITPLHLSHLSEVTDEKKQSKDTFCYRAFGHIFPQLFFTFLLVIYALLGAALFYHIEGSNSQKIVEFEAFLNKLWTYIESYKTGTEEDRKHHFITVTRRMIQDELKKEWLISSSEWSFLESLFFCCTVFTTVGYGDIYPRTRLGKIVCMLYALFGIPLMFLVMATVGDSLATIITTVYNNYKTLHVKISHIKRFAHISGDPDHVNQVSPRVKVKKLDHNINVQSSNKTTHQHPKEQCQKIELFENIGENNHENTLHVTPQMERSVSCPELEEMKSYPSAYKSFREVGTLVQHFDVPILMIALVVFAYISLGAAILPIWETHLNFETAFYFCFITFTTIGFGDISVNHRMLFLFCSVYVVVGMEIVFIAFKLLQKRLFYAYQTIVMFVTKWDIAEPREK
ncbi:potassium channel subfamily K member 18 [Petaurus breviceps papuanus]|uniref:potassium channel subfamily K member 18 n=1 Tax=Petaurus breviceps papuanus TaxID=3040969 RepID=UPI0036DA141F